MEAIAVHLREHQISVEDWRYRPHALELHRWERILDQEFKLRLPAYPVLKFASLRNANACYEWGRNELGIKDSITFNTIDLFAREMSLVIRTLLHELLHLWQHYHGCPAKSKPNYHNDQYRTKALRCGLVVTAEGCTTGHTQIFADLLAKHGVSLSEPTLPPAADLKIYGARGQNQKMKKWVCKCTPKPTIVRCATRLSALCVDEVHPETGEVVKRGCGQRFELA